jgi:hypothetical protein
MKQCFAEVVCRKINNITERQQWAKLYPTKQVNNGNGNQYKATGFPTNIRYQKLSQRILAFCMSNHMIR